jgi:uncharacterized protein (DUF58 family)
MGGILILFFVVLIVLAAFFQADFVLVVLYLMAGAFFISHWWNRRAARSVVIQRYFTERAFWGEKIPVRVVAKNIGILPVVWMHLRETLPLELAAEGSTQEVVHIGSKSQVSITYDLDCRKRGYYSVGPMSLFSGDLLGISQQQHLQTAADHLIVFPKIIPLATIKIPTNSPLGTLRSIQPVFEDPTRVRGKRNYIAGDSLRRIDWKTSAATRLLQVKLFEPSIALETMIILNLNQAEFEIKDRYYAPELAIVVAASIANWVTRARQAVGLATNGRDPLSGEGSITSIPPRPGQGHLMRLLEILARAQVAESYPLVHLIQEEIARLPWGTTLIVLANQVSDDLFDALFQSRRKGLSATLILCGYVEKFLEIQRRARYFNFPFYHILNEQDLEVWRN